jgi:transcriptional regulator with XRE-family HTH domain
MGNESPLLAVVPLDRGESRPNNDAVYKRAGKRVKAWRLEQGLDQVAFARHARISVGCYQGFEGGARATRKKNLVKIAEAIGLTYEQLLAEDDRTTTPDPLLKDLRREDLRLAQQFHHADAASKHAIKAFFTADLPEDVREGIAVLLEQILQLTTDDLVELERLISLQLARRAP